MVVVVYIYSVHVIGLYHVVVKDNKGIIVVVNVNKKLCVKHNACPCLYAYKNNFRII